VNNLLPMVRYKANGESVYRQMAVIIYTIILKKMV